MAYLRPHDTQLHVTERIPCPTSLAQLKSGLTEPLLIRFWITKLWAISEFKGNIITSKCLCNDS